MSIKSFHIFFVAISSLLFFFIGLYNFNQYLSLRDSSLLIYFISSLVCTLVLLVYGKKFVRKIKNIEHA